MSKYDQRLEQPARQAFTTSASWLDPRPGRLAPDAMKRVAASLGIVLAL